MIKIDTTPVQYLSRLDEKSFFDCAKEIPCIESIDGGIFHIWSKRLSESNLRELIAIMHRYSMPMKQLQQFCNAKNEHWFKSRSKFWYGAVFGSAD